MSYAAVPKPCPGAREGACGAMNSGETGRGGRGDVGSRRYAAGRGCPDAGARRGRRADVGRGGSVKLLGIAADRGAVGFATGKTRGDGTAYSPRWRAGCSRVLGSGSGDVWAMITPDRRTNDRATCANSAIVARIVAGAVRAVLVPALASLNRLYGRQMA
jgi:hypothetical protein